MEYSIVHTHYFIPTEFVLVNSDTGSVELSMKKFLPFSQHYSIVGDLLNGEIRVVSPRGLVLWEQRWVYELLDVKGNELARFEWGNPGKIPIDDRVFLTRPFGGMPGTGMARQCRYMCIHDDEREILRLDKDLMTISVQRRVSGLEALSAFMLKLYVDRPSEI